MSLVGTGVIVFGCTRWCTINGLISDHERLVHAAFKKYAADSRKPPFGMDDMSGMAAEIRRKIHLSRGTYQWAEGLIMSGMGGVSCLLTALYLSQDPRRRAKSARTENRDDSAGTET